MSDFRSLVFFFFVSTNVRGWLENRRSWGYWGAGQPQLTMASLHSSLSCRWHCMHALKCLTSHPPPQPVMKIPHVAHQTWLTLAPLAARCSSWSEGVVSDCTLPKRTCSYRKVPRRNGKRQLFHCSSVSGEMQWRAELCNPTFSNLSETTFWHLFSFNCSKPPENLFSSNCPLNEKRKASCEQNPSVILKRGPF